MNIFDHSHALFGFEQGKGVARLTAIRDRLALAEGQPTPGNRHCLLDVIQTDDYFDERRRRIQSIPDFFLEAICRDAIGLGIDPPEAEVAIEFLCYRRDHLLDIIEKDQAEFRAIREWSLFP